jgi:hypothetical protein
MTLGLRGRKGWVGGGLFPFPWGEGRDPDAPHRDGGRGRGHSLCPQRAADLKNGGPRYLLSVTEGTRQNAKRKSKIPTVSFVNNCYLRGFGFAICISRFAQ